MAKPLVRSILDGAQQIAVPAFVSTTAICIVFVPVLLLTGPAKFLFTPLALSVVFAMMMSYFLSRTLIPTMVHYMLESEVEVYAAGEEGLAHASGPIWAVHHKFNTGFEKMRASYHRALGWCLYHRVMVSLVYGGLVIASLFLTMVVGRDFFPYIDSGQIRLHVRAPEGTRLEETERVFADVEQTIRENLQAGELEEIVDNIGLPQSVNLAFSESSNVGESDGDILIALNGEHHRPTEGIQRQLRKSAAGEVSG